MTGLGYSYGYKFGASQFWPKASQYTAEAGPVWVAPYTTVSEGAANYGGLPYTAREALFKGPSYRIRQAGTISQIKIYTGADLTGVTGVYVKVWRRNEAGTYDQVGSTTENFLASLVVNTTVTIVLATPIVGVQVGDYYGLRITKTSGTQNIFRARTGIAGLTTYYVSNVAPGATGYDWKSKSTLANSAVPIELYMDAAPHIVGIGDSGMAGQPANYSFLQGLQDTYLPGSTIVEQFRDLLNPAYTVQNMGSGGDTTTDVATRLAADLIALDPKIAIIDGGMNNIRNPSGTVAAQKATFLSDWTTILDACAAALIPLVLVYLMAPYTSGAEYAEVVANVTVDGTALTIARAAGSWTTLGVTAGDWILLTGFVAGGGANNKWIQVESKTNSTITCPAGTVLTNEGPISNIGIDCHVMTTRDDWNEALRSLVANYPNARCVNVDALVGQFRASGPALNLWDQLEVYNADNLHYTADGYGMFARSAMAVIIK